MDGALRVCGETGEEGKNLVIGHYKIMEDMCKETVILLYVFFYNKKLYVEKRDHPSSLFYLPINIFTVMSDVVRSKLLSGISVCQKNFF